MYAVICEWLLPRVLTSADPLAFAIAHPTIFEQLFGQIGRIWHFEIYIIYGAFQATDQDSFSKIEIIGPFLIVLEEYSNILLIRLVKF